MSVVLPYQVRSKAACLLRAQPWTWAHWEGSFYQWHYVWPSHLIWWKQRLVEKHRGDAAQAETSRWRVLGGESRLSPSRCMALPWKSGTVLQVTPCKLLLCPDLQAGSPFPQAHFLKYSKPESIHMWEAVTSCSRSRAVRTALRSALHLAAATPIPHVHPTCLGRDGGKSDYTLVRWELCLLLEWLKALRVYRTPCPADKA